MSGAILRAIVPSSPLYKTETVQREIQKALDTVGKGMKKSFEATTATWETKVNFTVEAKLTGGNATIEVSTDNEIYGYVSGGTRPHTIEPKTARVLAFPSGFKAKTSVRSVRSRAGGSSGSMIFTRRVHHPGTKARHFERQIVVRYQDLIASTIQMAISRALRAG